MKIIDRNLVVKQTENVAEVAGSIAEAVAECGVRNIVGITCFDEYSALYICPATSKCSINLVCLNQWHRSGSGFMNECFNALMSLNGSSDRSLIFIDDLRDFFSQGQIYSPEILQECLSLISERIRDRDLIVVNSLSQDSINKFFDAI